MHGRRRSALALVKQRNHDARSRPTGDRDCKRAALHVAGDIEAGVWIVNQVHGFGGYAVASLVLLLAIDLHVGVRDHAGIQRGGTPIRAARPRGLTCRHE